MVDLVHQVSHHRECSNEIKLKAFEIESRTKVSKITAISFTRDFKIMQNVNKVDLNANIKSIPLNFTRIESKNNAVRRKISLTLVNDGII